MPSRAWAAIFVAVACLTSNIFVAAVMAQPLADKASSDERDQFSSLTASIESVADCVVKIENHDRFCCLGTIVADGLIVSKLSELSGSLTCISSNGQRVAGKIIASDAVDDIALVQLSTVEQDSSADDFGTKVEFGLENRTDVGDVLFSIGLGKKPLAIGVATVSPQKIRVEQPVCRDCVDLGVTISDQASEIEVDVTLPDSDSVESQTFAGSMIERVYPRTVGERIGLLKGDLLVSINQQPVASHESLIAIGSQLKVGQPLSVTVIRSGQMKQLKRTIDHFLRRVYHDRWGGGPFSDRRFGFGTTIIHDSLLKPDQCGGPLLDLDGNVIGINIARSMRVATLAIPSSRIVEFLNNNKPDKPDSH